MLHGLSEDNGALRATLTIDEKEAQQGVSRMIMLPGGRSIDVVVPAGAHHGQLLSLKGSSAEGQLEDVLLTIAIKQIEDIAPIYANADEPTMKNIPTAPLGTLDGDTTGSVPEEEETTIRYDRDTPPTISDEETLDIGMPLPGYSGDDEPTVRPYENRITAKLANVMETHPASVEDEEVTVRRNPSIPAVLTPAQDSSWRSKLQPMSQGLQTTVQSLRISSWWRTILLFILAFLIILAGGSFLYNGRINQLVVSSVQTTATAQIKAVSTSYAATTIVQASATASTALDPYPQQHGTLVFYDPLSNNTLHHGWNEAPGCMFTGRSYHVSAAQNSVNYCLASNAFNFKNFTYEVQITILNGDTGGILFRLDSAKNSYYSFSVDTKGGYALLYVDSLYSTTILNGSSKAIKTNVGSPNMLAVVAQGRNLDLYVNSQRVAGVNDSLFKGGQIGVIAGGTANTTEIACSDAKIWNI